MFLIALLEEWEAVTSTIASHRVSAKGTRKKRTQIRHLMLSLKLCDCRYDVLCLFKMQIRLQKALSLHEGGLTPLKWYSWPLWAQLMLHPDVMRTDITGTYASQRSKCILSDLHTAHEKWGQKQKCCVNNFVQSTYIYLFILWYNIIFNNKI